MSLIRRTQRAQWDPFSELEEMSSRLSRVLGQWPGTGNEERLSHTDWVPTVNVSESPEHYSIEVELPGVTKENAHVEVHDRVLTVSGERKVQEEKKKAKYHRIESFYGSFMRSFSLPEDADQDNIKANFKEGLLQVDVARKAQTSPKLKKIDIK
ncbi:MAG: Hsp20/alpha crystallin family protein [Myxococcales bacterium]|nr:MAG: Hsp20/alpha crystallin family protein [Myxococcales bacterium]